jgi:hypothetical protein
MSVNVTLKSVWDDRGIKNAERDFKKLGSGISKAMGAVGLSIGVAALAAGLKQAAKAAVEEQKSAALLEQQLQNTLGANNALVASVEESIRAMSINAAVADDELRPAFAQLVRATKDVDTATSMLQLALDVSAGTGRDLQSVTIALSKAYQGNTTALSRLGIKAEDGVDIFQTLKEQFSGAAEAAAQNDPFQRLSVIFGEVSEQIGQILIPYLNELADYFSKADFTTAVSNLTVSLGEAANQVNYLFDTITGQDALTFFIDLLNAVSVGVAEIAFTVADAADTIGKFFSGDFAGAGDNLSTFLTRYNKFVQDIYDKQDEAKAKLKPIKFNPITFAPIAPNTANPTTTAKSQYDSVRKVILAAQASILKAERDYTRTKFEINRDFEDRVAELRKTAADSQLSLIKDSQARITDAFRSATQLGLGNLFSSETTRQLETQVRQLSERLTVSVTKETEKTAYSSVTEIINGLRDRLSASKTLLANASELAALGFKQTFIEQVLETGTETGNALAGAILEASPETQSELKTLFGELESVSETGADSLAKSIYDKFGLATRELKNQSVTIQQELTAALQAENKILLTNLADAAYAFQTQISDIKTQFLADLDQFNGAFAGLGNTIKGVLGNLQSLLAAGGGDIRAALTAPGSGSVVAGASVTDNVAIKDIANGSGIVIDELSDVAGALAYLQARIAAGNAYIKNVGASSTLGMDAQLRVSSFATQLAELQGKAATGTAAGTIVNINVRTDSTQSQAMVGKTIGKIVTKYVTTGGQVLVSGN